MVNRMVNNRIVNIPAEYSCRLDYINLLIKKFLVKKKNI